MNLGFCSDVLLCTLGSLWTEFEAIIDSAKNSLHLYDQPSDRYYKYFIACNLYDIMTCKVLHIFNNYISRSVKKIQSLKMFRASKISSAAGISRAFIPSCRVSQPIVCRQNIQKRPCPFEISAPPPLPILCLQPARFYKTSPRLFIRRGAGYSGLPQRLKVNYKTGAYLVVMAMIITVACLR